MNKAEHTDPIAAPLVVRDKRRIVIGGDEGAALLAEFPNGLPPGKIEELPPPPTSRPALMYAGEFYEINGVCYFVRKVTRHDIVLRRFTGTLAMPKVSATALQLKGARRG